MIVHLARQDRWRVESLRVFLPVSSKLFQLYGGQLHHDRLSVLKSARCFWRLLVFFLSFLAAAGCCLVGNLVAPLLNGLSDGPHGGSDVGGGLRESEPVGNGGSDVGSRDGVGNGGSNGSNRGGGSVSSVGRGGVAVVGGGVTGKASVGVPVAKPVGVGHL